MRTIFVLMTLALATTTLTPLADAAHDCAVGAVCVGNSSWCSAAAVCVDSDHCSLGAVCVSGAHDCHLGAVCALGGHDCGLGAVCVGTLTSLAFVAVGSFNGWDHGNACTGTALVSFNYAAGNWVYAQRLLTTSTTSDSCSTATFDRSYSNADSDFAWNGDSWSIHHDAIGTEGFSQETTSFQIVSGGVFFDQQFFQDGQPVWFGNGLLTSPNAVR